MHPYFDSPLPIVIGHRGIPVHVWTINETAEMTRLLDLGVDGIVTDFPGRLGALLAERQGEQ
jgi:glycerophosphoryl diester phosphodiesterase